MRHVSSKIPVNFEDDGTAEPGEKVELKTREQTKEEAAAAMEDAMAGTEDDRLEQLYEQIAWPLADKYGHTYDAFKLALTYV